MPKTTPLIPNRSAAPATVAVGAYCDGIALARRRAR